MLLKHLVRPADFAIPLTLVAVGWTAVMLWSPRDLTVAALVGASLGALFVSLEDQGARATRYVGDALTAPVDLTRTVAVAFDGEAVDESSRERFDLERFAGSPDLTAVPPLLRATGANLHRLSPSWATPSFSIPSSARDRRSTPSSMTSPRSPSSSEYSASSRRSIPS